MENIINEMRKALEEITSRLEDVEKWIRNLDYRIMESPQAEEQKEKNEGKK